MGSPAHLVRRFFRSLRSAGPEADDELWALEQLVPGEADLWKQMPGFDRRHAVGVAREVDRLLAQGGERPVLAAALLHDVGKIASGFNVWQRVAATVWTGVRGRQKVAAGDGRMAQYVRHPDIGATLLREAGSDPLTVAWAAEHHLPTARWTLPLEIARALKAADDD